MHKVRLLPKFSRSRSGYTLIELAVVMVVAGLIIASFASAYNLYLKTQAEKLTDDNISSVTQAMSTYLVAFGSYPCPARANAKRTDLDYGISTQCDPRIYPGSASNPTPDAGPGVQPYVYPCSAASPGPGSVGCNNIGVLGVPGDPCNNGLCWQTSDRMVQTAAENPNILAGGGSNAMTQPAPVTGPVNSGAAITIKIPDATCCGSQNFNVTLPAVSPLIRRGMVPFRTLGLAEEQAYDGYHMRLEYAVTEALAVPGTYMQAGGAIDVLDPIGVTWFNAAKPLDGVSPAQAYGQHVLFKPPGMPAKDASGNYKIDQNNNSILIPTDGGGAHYVIYSAGADRAGAYGRDGVQSAPCGATGLDAQNCTTTVAKGIYAVGPTSTSHLADNTGAYKDGAGATVTIADTHFDDHVKYFSETETPLWKVSTATAIGQDIQDLINAGGAGNGRIGIGGAVTPGRTEAVQVGGDVHTITKVVAQKLRDPTAVNADVALPLTSACPGGQYATGLSGGSVAPGCSAVPPIACPPGQIATGFSGGTMTCSQNVFCASQQVPLCQVPTVATNDNRWLPSSPDGAVVDTKTVAPTGVSGDSYYETWRCNGGTWNRQSASGVCTCNPLTNDPRDQWCYNYYGSPEPTTYDNKVTWTVTVTCPGGAQTTSAQNTSACVCHDRTIATPGALIPCDPGYSGPGTQTTTYWKWTCSVPNGDGPGTSGAPNPTTVGTCTCNPAYAWGSSDTTRPYPNPVGYNCTGQQTRTWGCTPAGWSAWAPAQTNPPPAPASCTCVGTPDVPRPVPCGPGLTGTKTQMHHFNCGLSPPDWDPWFDYDTSQCGTLTYVWKPVGNADAGSYGSPLPNQAYQSCSTQGATGDCSRANSGTYIYYLNSGCQCE